MQYGEHFASRAQDILGAQNEEGCKQTLLYLVNP